MLAVSRVWLALCALNMSGRYGGGGYFSCYGNSSLGSVRHSFILHDSGLYIPYCVHLTHIFFFVNDG